MLNFYQRIRELSPEEFAALVSDEVMEDPHTALIGLREIAVRLAKLDTGLTEEDVLTWRNYFNLTARTLQPIIVKSFAGHDEIHWLFGRALHRLELSEQALPHISYVCKLADEQGLRAKAFARAAEINLTLFDQTLSIDFAATAFEAAQRADTIEKSLYTADLHERARRILYASWHSECHPILSFLGHN